MNKKAEIEEQQRQDVEFIGLSKDDKKAIAAYDLSIQKGLAIFKGEPLKPLTKIPKNGIEELMEEFLGDEIKLKKEEFKVGFKEVLAAKSKLDRFIKEQQVAFNKAVVAQKKEFTKKANVVLNIIDGIEALRNNYMETLGDAVEQKAEGE